MLSPEGREIGGMREIAQHARLRGVLPENSRSESILRGIEHGPSAGSARFEVGHVAEDGVSRNQPRNARDPLLRRMMASIARDEARHALLAWEVDGWARAALGERGTRALSAHRRRVADELMREVGATPAPDPSQIDELGLPPPPMLQRLAADAHELLWDATAA